MEKGLGKWRFTSPTHVVRAFKQALAELLEEGGVEARYQLYCENHRILVEGMRFSRFPNFARRRYSVTDYHFFPLPA